MTTNDEMAAALDLFDVFNESDVHLTYLDLSNEARRNRLSAWLEVN